MAGRYEILQASAGEGGFGRVDKARDTELDRDVAIKTLDPIFKSSPSPQDIERFRREAKALARLSHPHIPAIYDVQFSESDKEFKIIFEWIDGQTLRDHLQDRGVLTLEESRQLFSRICSALSHAHGNRIIHRDIKPSNIILTPDMASSYLVDFGIALNSDELTSITGGSPIGTPGYMSPEQERGDELQPSSDIFSLGILLYECLAGSRPMVGGYKSLSIHNESIPPSVDTLIQAALRDDPASRPASAQEFHDRLNESLRPHANFTAILAEGSLYEIQLALNQMEPVAYLALPEGQKVLILTRLRDLINVDDPRVRNAVASLLAELVRLAHDSKPDQYREIVHYTFDYGFEKQYGETWHGNAPAREGLKAVSLICDKSAHAQISSEVLTRVDESGLENKQGWYFHDLRLLVQNLLTNASCSDENAEPLGKALTRINEISHAPSSS